MPSLFHEGVKWWDSPYINHFLQPDTIIPSPASPKSWNRYSYVVNNPINASDPSGHICVGEPGECLNNGGTRSAGFTGTGGARTKNAGNCSDVGCRGKSGKPIIPENVPCNGLLSCEPLPPTKDEFIQDLVGLGSEDICQFFHLQPYMCDSSLWQSLPSSVSLPPFEPMRWYCGSISGLACAAMLSQDIAMLIDMVGVGLIETPAVAVGCFEGGPAGCAIAEVGVIVTWNLTLNNAETWASGASLGFTILDDLNNNGGWGENSSTAVTTFIVGSAPLTPSWDLAVDIYGSAYNRGIVNGVDTIWQDGLFR